MTPLGRQRLLAALPPLLLLFSLASPASADAITGRVVDSNGVGVAGVDIDVINLGGGGNPHELNDGTDANGFFLTTIDQAGVYEVRFYPPPPPVTTHLTGVVTNLVVVGTKDMGTITLGAGVSTAGAVKNSGGVPVANVKVDVFNRTTGAKYLMKDNVTNAFGNYNVAVPVNTQLRVEFLTKNVIGQVLVPREVFGSVSGPITYPDITLQTGFHVTGTVRNQLGAAVSGADIDVTNPVTGSTLFTPSDNTDSLGAFDVVLAPGTYDLEVNRPAAQVLVGVDVDSMVVSAATNLGILTMRDGVFLSGTVRDQAGAVVAAADVNVFEVATGQSIALGSDNTNASGFYSVVVPTGLLDVVFSPPGKHHALEKDRHFNFLVTGNATLDGQFPSVPGHVSTHPGLPKPPVLPLGPAAPGTGGAVPHVRGTITGTGLTLWISGGRPGAVASLLVGFGERDPAGQPRPELLRARAGHPLVLDARGEARLELPLGRGVGGDLHVRLAVPDREARDGIALSHVLAIEPTR
jgi:hypothetical protein